MTTTVSYPYSVLGEGAKTSLLRAGNDWNVDTHTRVLSCDNTTARSLAVHLATLTSDLPNALWDVAVDAHGTAAGARRHLLSVFDGAQVPATEGPWRRADGLIAAVAQAVSDATDAVRAAARREIVENALSWVDDGILVGGVLWANARRPGYLRLVLNPIFGDSILTASDGTTRTENQFFGNLDLASTRANAPDVHPAIEIDCVVVEHYEMFDLVQDLRDYEECGDRPAGEDPAEIIFDESDGNGPYLTVALSHLEAYIASNQPSLLG